MSALTTSANSTAFGNSTGRAGSFNNTTGTGNTTAWGTPSNDIALPFGPEFWIPIVRSHMGARRLTVCFLAWVAYDAVIPDPPVITIDDSINLFWKHRWSFSKAMYLISRYSSLFTVGVIAAQVNMENPSISFCMAAPWIIMGSAAVLITIINLAMVTRVYALWNMDVRILIFSLFGSSLNIGSYVVLLSYSFVKGVTLVNVPPLAGCSTWPGFDKVWIIFVASIGFESMIICLTVYKAWSVAAQRGIRTPLYTLILEDGVAYFIIIVLSQVLTMAALYIPSPMSGPVAWSLPFISVSGIACNRLFTRLQRLLLDERRGQTSFPTEDFATPSSPQTSYGSATMTQSTPSPRHSEQRSPLGTPRLPRSSLGTRRRRWWERLWTAAGVGFGFGFGDTDMAMKRVSRLSTRNRDPDGRGRSGRDLWCGRNYPRRDSCRVSGSLDEEIDLSGHSHATEAI